MFFAALRSACSVWPQATPWKRAWQVRFSAATCPQTEHCWLAYAGVTATSIAPRQAVLYWSIKRDIGQPLRRIARFIPALASTFLPGTSVVPAALTHIAGGQAVFGLAPIVRAFFSRDRPLYAARGLRADPSPHSATTHRAHIRARAGSCASRRQSDAGARWGLGPTLCNTAHAASGQASPCTQARGTRCCRTQPASTRPASAKLTPRPRHLRLRSSTAIAKAKSTTPSRWPVAIGTACVARPCYPHEGTRGSRRRPGSLRRHFFNRLATAHRASTPG
jgi:hypothetical protein